MDTSFKKSHAWAFIVATTVILFIFLIESLTQVGGNTLRATSATQMNVVFSFFSAALALGLGIAANASAYLNPTSPSPTRVLSPILIFLVAMSVIPFFVSLGLALVS